MLTIQTVQNIKTGSRVTLFNGIYAMALGVLYLGFYKFMIKINFKAIDAVWQIFTKYNPELSSMLIRLMILKGIFIIIMGFTIAALSSYIIKKKDKHAWVMLFIIGLVFWGALIAMEVLDGNYYAVAASTIGWIMFIIGMLIPLKYYMQKEYIAY